MPKSTILYSFLIVLIAVNVCLAQQTDLRKEQQMEELVESLATSEDGSSESSLLLDDLSYYSAHPLYINKVTEDELMRLNLLNFKQVRSIISYRKKYGSILTIRELAVMGDFSEELLQKIQPFLVFERNRDSVQIRRDNIVYQSLLARIKSSFPTSVGYSSSKGKPPVYGGKPYSYFMRYRGEVGQWLDIGITAENDAGEDFFGKSNKMGFDFLSGFLSWKGKGVIQKIVLGDFHLRFGQGVSLWSGGGVSFSSDLSSMMRSGEGIRPYSSTDENVFFRGVATQLSISRLKLSLFFSDKNKDANLSEDSVVGNFITSFRLDGLHRTSSEKTDEKNVKERLMGAYADFRFEQWRFGILASMIKFGNPVSKGNSPYKQKSFEGDFNVNIGTDYQCVLNQFSLFGEIGVSGNMRVAFLNGLLWKAHPQLSLSFLYRFYDPAFHTFSAGSFGAGSGGKNEEGFFFAFEYCPLSKVKLSGQADLYYFPWMTYQTVSPSSGKSFSFRADVTIRPDLVVYLQSRFVAKPQKVAGGKGVPEQFDEETSKWRVHLDWKVNEKLQLRSRLEKTGYSYNQKNENGYLIFQDLIVTPSSGMKFWFRLAYYNTDSYDSRVYSYENDLLYYFAIPEFHGSGVRTYLNIKWLPIKMLTLYLKAGYTLRQDAESMGSGNDASPGNHRFDIRSQIAFKF
ncbi:MAG TPA: helix-hairpin-helix domain-containing protein [Prolixibacteraceae bacterium]